MKGWVTKQIRQLGKVVTGKTPPTSNPDFFGGGELFVSPKDLDWNGYFIKDTQTRVTQKALQKFKNQVLPKNSIMFTSLSFAFGKMGITSRPSLTNQQINSIVTNEENHFKFVYYLLQTYKPIIFSYNSGIDTPIVPKSVFEGIEVNLPRLKKHQEKIAAILSAYDDLIENNRRRIGLLEKMAEEIYREWFVRFRFPGHKQVKIVKGAPEGWKVKKLGDVIELCYGKALKEQDRIPGEFHVYGSSGIIGTHTHALVKEPGIIIGRKGNVGSVYWSDRGFFPIDTAYYVKSKLNSRYLFFLLQSMNFINNDAAVPGLNRNQAYSNQFFFPPIQLIDSFGDIADSIFRTKQNLTRKNEFFMKSRDLLLPRLISGKLSVENLDIQLPPSMEDHP